MTSLETVLNGISVAMETAVPDLTTALPREADPTDNTVSWPHGEILIVSNVRSSPYNTDLVGYATDSNGNQIGRIYDALFDIELQLNVWIAVPSDAWDVQSLGNQLRRGMYKYDNGRISPDPLPDGSGGTLDTVSNFTIDGGGELPVEEENPPLRGYQLTVSFRFSDRIDTSVEYGEMDYVETVDHPSDGDLTGGTEVAIEYTT